jgi:hypothetical protein
MARRKKETLNTRLAAAKASASYMVAVWKVQDGKVELFRQTEGFPLADIPAALEMLQEDLKPITIVKEPE